MSSVHISVEVRINLNGKKVKSYCSKKVGFPHHDLIVIVTLPGFYLVSGSHGEFLDCESWPGVLGDVEDGLAGNVSVVEGSNSVEGEGITQAHKNKGDQASLETYK